MSRLDEQEQDSRELMRRAMAFGVLPALMKLAHAARGQYTFDNDHELRACVAMSRLAALLYGQPTLESPPPQLAHPAHSPRDIERLLDIVEGKTTYGDSNE